MDCTVHSILPGNGPKVGRDLLLLDLHPLAVKHEDRLDKAVDVFGWCREAVDWALI